MRSMEGKRLQGILLKGIGGFYYAQGEDGSVYTLRAQGKLRRDRTKPKVGDRVEFSPGAGEEHGWILRIEPRKNELTRPPVANVDVIAIVVAAASPEPDLLLADRLMLNARRAGIGVKLVVSKSDLDPARAEAILNQYRGADVSPIAVSSANGTGIDALRSALSGRIHALAGQSGAGKSTLINALYGLNMETGDLSRKIERGKNTTRHCELIPVSGGMVLDTPGFSLLESEPFDPVLLKDGYPEFAPYEGQCFFRPCYHATEPKCAVLDAVRAGEIDEERHARYVALLAEIKEQWRDRYD